MELQSGNDYEHSVVIMKRMWKPVWPHELWRTGGSPSVADGELGRLFPNIAFCAVAPPTW